MDKKTYKKGEGGITPIKELKWMAEFLARHGETQKALEIYRELVETMIVKGKDDPPGSNKADDRAA